MKFMQEMDIEKDVQIVDDNSTEHNKTNKGVM